MRFIGNNNNKKLRIFLLSIVFILSGVIMVVFIRHRSTGVTSEKISSPIQKKASMFLDNVYQESIRDGIKEWSLNAGSACYVDEKHEVVFQNISVTFFLKDGGEIYLKAKHGILKTDSKNIDVKGNVVVETESYRLTASQLFYDNNNRIIYSKNSVKITENALNLSAASICVDLDTNRIDFEGEVSGVFSATYNMF